MRVDEKTTAPSSGATCPRTGVFVPLCGTLDGLLDLVGTEDVMTPVKAQTQTATLVETIVAPAAIERALSIL